MPNAPFGSEVYLCLKKSDDLETTKKTKQNNTKNNYKT